MSKTALLPDGVRLLRGDAIISGVQIVPKRRIPDERGTIFHMLRETDDHFTRFGEIYFSTVYQGIVKGWHKHEEMTLHYVCVHGRVKIVLFDERPDSKTKDTLMEVFLGPDSHSLVIIPPNVWNGFKGMAAPESIVANCCSHAHDPKRSSRLDPFTNHIPYDWAAKHH